MENPNPMHILICPLDWGLGHAARMARVIRLYLNDGHTVTVAGSKSVNTFMFGEFENRIGYVHYPGYAVKYSRNNNLVWKILWQLPLLVFSMIKEQISMQNIVLRIKPDLILSDNRFGARSKKVRSIFITHQTSILLPSGWKWLQKTTNYINHKLISRFHKCIVPDYQELPGLAGKLSHGAKLPHISWCGPLSRFSGKEESYWKPPPFEIPPPFLLVILSGPEPQRTILENKLKTHIQKETTLWFRGLPGQNDIYREGKHIFFNHGSTHLMGWCIKNSKLVICRSGYSSVMDLAVFGKKALFIPTPGQTEQEYLAEHLEKQGYIAYISQKHLNIIHHLIPVAEKLPGLPVIKNDALFRTAFGALTKIETIADSDR